ncbi:MAG: DUF2400 family protein [Candidatus Helarchaeota archaeon]
MVKSPEYIKIHLEEAYNRLKEVYLETSVLKAVRMYVPQNTTDLELWSNFCAITNFQVSVIKHLIPMLSNFYKEIEYLGYKFIDLIYDLDLAKKILSNFCWNNKKGFKHRFIKIDDLIYLFISYRKLLSKYDSLGNFTKQLYEDTLNKDINEPIEYVIKNLAKEFRMNFPKEYKNHGILIPDPMGKSAFKRINLFLRWMVRPYPDLNVWNFINKKYLLTSVDSGIIRTVNRVFNKPLSNSFMWKNVLDITRLFRSINSEDPTKYDYIFSRPAIMNYCTKNSKNNRCYLCPLNEICDSAYLPIKRSVKPLTSEKERLILDHYLTIERDFFDTIETEYSIGNRYIDVVAHDKTCNWYVIEVKEKLNYIAIGQVITYRKLFIDAKNIRPKTIILCKEAPDDLKNACEIDIGVKIILVSF